MVINDLRRNSSGAYVNRPLGAMPFYAALAAESPLTQLPALNMEELKNMSCILVSPKGEEASEELFFREYLGVQGDFLFAESVEESNLLVVAGHGYAPSVFRKAPAGQGISYLPLFRNRKAVCRPYYMFWRTDNAKAYIEDFAALVKAQFSSETRG